MIIKLSPMEADDMFPCSEETEKPTGEVYLKMAMYVIDQVVNNSGPYSDIGKVKDWEVLDSYPVYELHGDMVVDVAKCKIHFEDGTTEDVLWVCHQ